MKRLTDAATILFLKVLTVVCIMGLAGFLGWSCVQYHTSRPITPEVYAEHEQAIRNLGLSAQETAAALKSLKDKYGDRVRGKKDQP